MKALQLTKDQLEIVNDIVDHLIEIDGQKPTAEHVLCMLTDDRTYLFAALSDDNVVLGYALAYRFPSLYSPSYIAYLYDIEVLEIHRRKGAGRLLMETVCEKLKSHGVRELWLGTASDNREGQALFSSTGGVRSEEFFNDFSYEL